MLRDRVVGGCHLEPKNRFVRPCKVEFVARSPLDIDRIGVPRLDFLALLFFQRFSPNNFPVQPLEFDFHLVSPMQRRQKQHRTGAKVAGPIPLPTDIWRHTVNRSPHCDKKSMESFEMRTHKRLLDIIDPTAKTVDELKKLNLPAGVDITIKI